MYFSTKFHIPARQVDFVNINLTKDNKLFIDPLKIKIGDTDFHKVCYSRIEGFVEVLIQLAKEKKYNKLLEYIDNFYERNETRLGYSIRNIRGKSFGPNGGKNLVSSLFKEDIFNPGFIEDIYDFLIMIPNIAEDKVSDIITTIILLDLVDYTQKQCGMWKIPTKELKIAKLCWNPIRKVWEERRGHLPTYLNKPIVLVPKSFVGKSNIFSYRNLYRDVIIPLYKELELKKKDSRFVVRYKNGRVHVLGNKLREEYPCTKYVILDFIKKYDSLYRQYKDKCLSQIIDKELKKNWFYDIVVTQKMVYR